MKVNILDISSEPHALFGFRSFKSFRTPASSIWIADISGKGDGPRSGMLLMSSRVNTELNCSLSILAFSTGSEPEMPSFNRVVTPQVSFRMLLR